MPQNSLKLKQRAALISILNKYTKADRINNDELKKDIETISKFEDKEFVFKTLLNEIGSSKNNLYGDICSIIALEAIEDNEFEKIVYDILKDEKMPDAKKFTAVSLMKQKGINFNFADIESYISNPEVFTHDGVDNFLKDAICDPEVQIDLLDFYLNIPQEERVYFLNNLQEEFSGDNLANAFSLLIQLKPEISEFETMLSLLLESDSPYALDGLNFALQNHKFDTKMRAKIKRVIKKINTKNPDFKNEILTKDSEIYKCYIGFVDGKSNFPLVFSRRRKNNTIDTLFASANINDGIISCMGFCAIDIENFASIMKRLFNDSLPVEINPVALKSLYNHYLEKSEKNNVELPYELIVWKNILNDIRAINYDISEFINSKLEIIKLTKQKVKKFASSKMLETWYYSHGQNPHTDALIAEIEKRHTTDLDEINELVSKTIDEKFLSDKKFMTELQSKLLIQSYVANIAKLKITSSCAYSLCFKNPYIKMLITSSIDKSLYYYFSTVSYGLDESNIFKKNNKPETNFTKDELELLMAQLEEKWS